MAEVHLKAVGKTYRGGVTGAENVSFQVPDGGFCVLVGPSGCGKSTLLRMVAGLELVTSGEIRIGERLVNDLEPMDRDIAMVFQNYALYPHMNVFDNMAYGLRNRKMPEAEVAQRVAEAARILELEPYLARKPKELSGGQRQRVAMGRAIVRKPQVFLFDEPLSNLDAKLRGTMRVEIRKLQRQLGVTALYVTHDQLEAMTLADMLVVMNKGRVEQIGKPIEVYERPATRFVAEFIGAPPMNMIRIEPGQVAAGLAGLEALALPPRRVLLGLRAEHLHGLGATEPVPAGALSLTLTVEAVEAVGAETYLYGQLEGAGQMITIREPGKVELPPGTRRRFLIPQPLVHGFDPGTEQRLPGF